MTFAPAFTAPTWSNLQVLLWGAILSPGQRTVTSALEAVGLGEVLGNRFGKYHRALSRAHWSPLCLSRLLLGLTVRMLVPADMPLVLIVDETLERRRGPQIRYLGWFRDAVRSTGSKVTFALGIRWCCICLLVHVPWCRRNWALPFIVMPTLSTKLCEKLDKVHRSPVYWAQWALRRVRRWHPDRPVVLIGDGSYSALDLVATAQELTKHKPSATVVTGLRLDAGLYDFVSVRRPGERGRNRLKGAPLPRLRDRLKDPNSSWQDMTITWYGGQSKHLQIISEVCLWYKRGTKPVPIRWVLVRAIGDPHFKPAAYLCSDENATPQQILEWVIERWNIEVTFEEMRAHLGFETQRQWSQGAIERTTPCLFGIFTLVVLMACLLHPEPDSLPTAKSSWYKKEEPTFSDAIAAVRHHLWQSERWDYGKTISKAKSVEKIKDTSLKIENWSLIPTQMLNHLQNMLCYAR